VQHQIRNGCVGSGYVVVDVLADSATVWNTLLGFERYADMIPTIRKVKITSRWPSLTKGVFTLSKFRFRLSVVHKHAPEEVRSGGGCRERSSKGFLILVEPGRIPGYSLTLSSTHCVVFHILSLLTRIA